MVRRFSTGTLTERSGVLFVFFFFAPCGATTEIFDFGKEPDLFLAGFLCPLPPPLAIPRAPLRPILGSASVLQRCSRSKVRFIVLGQIDIVRNR